MPVSHTSLKTHVMWTNAHTGTIHQRGECPHGSTGSKAALVSDNNIDIVVNLYHTPDPELKSLVNTYIHVPMPDGVFTDEHRNNLSALAEVIASELRIRHNVMIQCHAGRNRSSLLTALVIRELTRCSGSDAMAYVREHRANAIANPMFESFLNTLPALNGGIS